MNKLTHSFKRPLLLFGALAAAMLAFATPASAQNVPQGYQSDQPLQNGMIVRINPKDGAKVQAVTQQDAGEIQGVVVSSRETAVSLSNTEAKQEVFVANYGQFDVLVSTQNGVIKTGDYVTVSSLSGVGMKATSKQEFVLGKALKGFDGQSASEGTTVLKTSEGEKTISLGRVPIEISIAHNPSYNSEKPVAGVPDFLASMAHVVTNGPVSAYRVYVSAGVLLLCAIVGTVILFAGVRTAMTAVGRNPLAKKSITRSLIQVVLIALIVFVIGLIAVYLLLKV